MVTIEEKEGQDRERGFVVVVQSVSHVQFFVTPWNAAHQTPLFSTVSWSLLRFMSMLSNHLILCCPLLILPSVFPSIRVCSIYKINKQTRIYCTAQRMYYIFYNNYKWSITFQNCELLGCTPETHIILYINYISIKDKAPQVIPVCSSLC